MTHRKPITDKMKWTAIWYRFGIPCYICKGLITFQEDFEFDHIVELADDGEHSFANIAPAHIRCHDLKSAKSETQRSRIDRLENEKNGLPKRARDRFKKKIPSRPFPKRPTPTVERRE